MSSLAVRTPPEPNLGPYHVRKWFTLVEDTLATETGELADGPTLRKVVIAAAVRNPFAGTFGADLDAVVADSHLLGEEFGRRLVAACGGEQVASYGKACIVGTDGSYEHGNAFLTQVFANPIRDLVGGGTSWFPSTGKRAAGGSAIDIPLAHKDELYVRSHYDTITVTFTDTPAPDEVVVAVAVATRGRLHARLGGISADQVAAGGSS